MSACEIGCLREPDPNRILALVLAGGEGSRLHPLTAACPKPMLPFAGRRIIDFVLSNLVNSGIRSIYVLAQYKAHAIARHVESGWNGAIRREGGFVKVVEPQPGFSFDGTADAVYKSLDLVRAHGAEAVAVFAADHVYRMDVSQMMRFHRSAGADVTIAALPVPLREARAFGAIAASDQGRVRRFEEKAAHPEPMASRRSHAFVSMGNYVFEPAALVELLTEANRRSETDFGRHVLPRALASQRVYAYDFTGNRVPGVLDSEESFYWRDVGTVNAYLAAQEDVLVVPPRFRLENPQWPIGSGGYPLRGADQFAAHGRGQPGQHNAGAPVAMSA